MIGGRDRIEWKRGRVLSAGGEGRQLRRGSCSGARGQGKRLERGELSHSTVATSSPPASLMRPNAAACDVCGLCQCRLPRMVLLEDFPCLPHVRSIDVADLTLKYSRQRTEPEKSGDKERFHRLCTMFNHVVSFILAL